MTRRWKTVFLVGFFLNHYYFMYVVVETLADFVHVLKNSITQSVIEIEVGQKSYLVWQSDDIKVYIVFRKKGILRCNIVNI